MMVRNQLTLVDIECLEKRTEKAIKRFGIEDLPEYSVGCPGGSDLEDLYRTVVEEVLLEESYVTAYEICSGKYEVTFEFECKDRWFIDSYAWDTVKMIVENLMDNVIIPHIKKGGRKPCQGLYTA